MKARAWKADQSWQDKNQKEAGLGQLMQEEHPAVHLQAGLGSSS